MSTNEQIEISSVIKNINNRYENTKIYKLIHPDSGYYYIGSSCDRLSRRLCDHKKKAKLYTDRKVFKAFNELGWSDIKIVLILDYAIDKVISCTFLELPVFYSR